MTFQGGLKTHKLKQLKSRYIGMYPPVERIGAVDCSYFINSVSDFQDVIQVRSNSDEDWLSEDFFFLGRYWTADSGFEFEDEFLVSGEEL